MTYKTCSRCVMDTSDSRITFDEFGVCDHCKTYDRDILSKWRPNGVSDKDLDAAANEIRRQGKSNEFDCIIGMSGGIDSSYLLYLAKSVLKLNPLVFHVDAGWNSQEAVNNIEKLVDGLDLELYTEVIDWEEMKDLQLAFFKSGVPHIDTPQDHAFFATMYKFAAKHNVKNILTGGNYSTECVRNPIEWMYYQTDKLQLMDIHNKFGQRPLRNFPTTNIFWHKFYLPVAKGIKVRRLLDLMPYNKEDATKILEKKFGFQRYPQKHFESRFTRFYEGFWLPEKFGYDTRKVQFSSLILTKQMSRSEALELLKEPAMSKEEVQREFEYVAKKLEISLDQLTSYLHAPNKTFKDYRSQQALYDLGSKIFRLLGIEKGGKR